MIPFLNALKCQFHSLTAPKYSRSGSEDIEKGITDEKWQSSAKRWDQAGETAGRNAVGWQTSQRTANAVVSKEREHAKRLHRQSMRAVTAQHALNATQVNPVWAIQSPEVQCFAQEATNMHPADPCSASSGVKAPEQTSLRAGGVCAISTSVPKGKADFCPDLWNKPGPWGETLVKYFSISDSAHVFPFKENTTSSHSTPWLAGEWQIAEPGEEEIRLCSQGQSGLLPLQRSSSLLYSKKVGPKPWSGALKTCSRPLRADLTAWRCRARKLGSQLVHFSVHLKAT